MQLSNRAALVALLSSSLSLSVVIVQARLQGPGAVGNAAAAPRALANENKVTVDTWDDCVNMTPTECESHIVDTMDGDLSNHAVPDLNIVVSPARTPHAIAQTYWEVGIPTTVTGEVDCNLNYGDIRFPHDWETLEGTYTLQPVNCAGLQAVPCCEKVIADMEQRVIPLVDVHGNCFSCRAHQEPLEPHIDFGTGEEFFMENTFDNGECKVEKLTQAQVQAEDALVAAALVGVRGEIEAVLHADTVMCSDAISLHHNLLTYARSLPHVMSKVVGMLCGVCDMLHDTGSDVVVKDGLSSSARSDLQWMHNELATAVIRSDYSDIVLYTDAYRSKVMKAPVVGGSRTGSVTDTDMRGACVAPAIADGDGGCDCTSMTGLESDGANGCQCIEEGHHPILLSSDSGSASLQGCSKCPAGEFWDVSAQTCYACVAPSQVMILDDGTPICECPAAALEDLQLYWEGLWKNTEADNTKCMCPPGHGLVELDHICYCPGGYKLWNAETESCQCPHGLKEDGASCICPGPHSGLDWNNVGWLDNGRGSCKVDFDCSLSPKDYYSDFEEGCSTCKLGYTVDPADGHCVLNCDRTKGLAYSRRLDKCICENKAFKFSDVEQKCTCETVGMEYNEAQEECECPPGFYREHTYSGYEVAYKCTAEDTGGDGYYGYNNYGY